VETRDERNPYTLPISAGRFGNDELQSSGIRTTLIVQDGVVQEQ
jgi:hypothetical protein